MKCEHCGQNFEIHSLGRWLWGHFCHTADKWFYSNGVRTTDDIHDFTPHTPLRSA